MTTLLSSKQDMPRKYYQDYCNPTKVPINPGAVLHDDKQGVAVDATEYRWVIRCLRYLLHTRPDLAFSVGMASRFMERPTVMHQNAVKQILRYLQGTLNYGTTRNLGFYDDCQMTEHLFVIKRDCL